MNREILVRKAERLLAVPDSFRQTALSFPGKVDEALALVESVDEAQRMLHQADTLAHFARRVKADTEIVNSIQYGKLKIVAKIGELSPATPREETGRGKKKTLAPGQDFPPPHTASRYRKVALHQTKLDAYREKCGTEEEITLGGFVRFATGTEKAGTAAHVSANTGVPEWYTPPEYIEAARAVLGEIELDPASSEIAQQAVQAKRYYTVDDDGLSQPWSGRVWLNPPYSADLVGKFVCRLCEHVESGNDAILLVNNATETKWFQRAAKIASAICFPSGRVKFLDEKGEPGAPLQGQAVLYFGKSNLKFVKQFDGFGFSLIRTK